MAVHVGLVNDGLRLLADFHCRTMRGMFGPEAAVQISPDRPFICANNSFRPRYTFVFLGPCCAMQAAFEELA